MRKKITVAAIEAANPIINKNPLWCNEPVGFGVRVNGSGKKAFIFKYRMDSSRSSKTQTITIGTYKDKSGKGIWTLPQAREKAKDHVELVRQGIDPKTAKEKRLKEHTIKSLCSEYIEKGMSHKKPSTIKTDIGRINAHILPLLGSKKVTEIKRRDIKQFLDDITKGKTAQTIKTKSRGVSRITGGAGTATRTTRLLGGIFSYACENDYITTNPVHGVQKPADKKLANILTNDDCKRIAAALKKSTANPKAITIIHLLYFTGLRRGEVEKLKWSQINFEKKIIYFSDTKTGAKEIMINEAALDILNNVEKEDNSDFVFPATRGEGHYFGTPKVWNIIRQEANVSDVRLHDFRHNFASTMASNGMNALMIKSLMAHHQLSSTERYTHMFADPQREAANKLGGILSARLK